MRSQRALVTDWNWRSLEWHKYTLFSQYNTQQRITQCLGGKANEHTVQRIRMIQWHKVKGISNDQNVQSVHEIHFDILTFIVNIKIKKTQRNNEIGQPYENRTWQKFFVSVRRGCCWFFFILSFLNLHINKTHIVLFVYAYTMYVDTLRNINRDSKAWYIHTLDLSFICACVSNTQYFIAILDLWYVDTMHHRRALQHTGTLFSSDIQA